MVHGFILDGSGAVIERVGKDSHSPWRTRRSSWVNSLVLSPYSVDSTFRPRVRPFRNEQNSPTLSRQPSKEAKQ